MSVSQEITSDDQSSFVERSSVFVTVVIHFGERPAKAFSFVGTQ